MTIDAPLNAVPVSAPVNSLLTSRILFALVGAAMVVLGLGTTASVALSRWGK